MVLSHGTGVRIPVAVPILPSRKLSVTCSGFLGGVFALSKALFSGKRRTRASGDGPEPGALYSTKACRWPSPTKTPVVHSDPEILSGTPVFVGTRVPVQSLFDYIEGGESLDEFLRQFPSVRREQAIAALELARGSLMTRARTA